MRVQSSMDEGAAHVLEWSEQQEPLVRGFMQVHLS